MRSDPSCRVRPGISRKVGTSRAPRYTTGDFARTMGKGARRMNRQTAQAFRQQIETVFAAGTMVGLSDGQLLERFRAGSPMDSEAAFTLLVERHGPMVLRVCRSVLRDTHDAEDSFQ